MDSSNLQRGAIGFYLESLAGPLKYYFNEPDLLVLFKDYAPIPKSGVCGATYRQTLMALPGQVKRDLSLRCLENIKFEGVPSFIFGGYKSSLMAISPFCDGQMYYLLNVIENAIDFCGDKLGTPYIKVAPNRVEVRFKNVYDYEAYISLEYDDDFPSDSLSICIYVSLLQKLLDYTQKPSQEQVNTLVKELIVKDRVKEEMPSIASYFSDISIRFHPWVGLEIRLTGIQ